MRVDEEAGQDGRIPGRCGKSGPGPSKASAIAQEPPLMTAWECHRRPKTPPSTSRQPTILAYERISEACALNSAVKSAPGSWIAWINDAILGVITSRYSASSVPGFR